FLGLTGAATQRFLLFPSLHFTPRLGLLSTYFYTYTQLSGLSSHNTQHNMSNWRKNTTPIKHAWEQDAPASPTAASPTPRVHHAWEQEAPTTPTPAIRRPSDTAGPASSSSFNVEEYARQKRCALVQDEEFDIVMAREETPSGSPYADIMAAKRKGKQPAVEAPVALGSVDVPAALADEPAPAAEPAMHPATPRERDPILQEVKKNLMALYLQAMEMEVTQEELDQWKTEPFAHRSSVAWQDILNNVPREMQGFFVGIATMWDRLKTKHGVHVPPPAALVNEVKKMKAWAAQHHQAQSQ
ncbi:hypothetical protein DFJ77DRAFT_520461, partial [Powellomyces hirtus]